MRRFDLERHAAFFFFFDFPVDRGYQHFVAAFLARFAFFEYVVSSLELSHVFEAAFFAFDGCYYWGNHNLQFRQSSSCLEKHVGG